MSICHPERHHALWQEATCRAHHLWRSEQIEKKNPAKTEAFHMAIGTPVQRSPVASSVRAQVPVEVRPCITLAGYAAKKRGENQCPESRNTEGRRCHEQRRTKTHTTNFLSR
jgi:hypothetical protein